MSCVNAGGRSVRELVTMNELDAIMPTLHDVPDCDRLVREIEALSGPEVVTETKRRWPLLKRDAWAFALLVERMGRERLFRPYASLSEWARRELKREAWVVSKHRTAAEWVLQLDVDDRRAVMDATPPAVLTEAGVPSLAVVDRKEALRLAKAGLTQQELRQAVRARLAGKKDHEPSELRTIHKVVPQHVYERFGQALNVVRFLCQTDHPSDAEVVELLCEDFLSGIQIAPEILERWPIEAIMSGSVRCMDCGATAGARIELHHSHPRSHQGHDSPLVPLCTRCHESITQNRDGRGWREAVKEWMGRADMAWFTEAFTAYLAGRTLDTL